MNLVSSTRAWLLAAVCLGSMYANAQEAALVSQQTPTDRLYDIEIVGQEGYAVGENGLIMKTTDGGTTWEKQESPTKLALVNVAVYSKGAVAVGQLGEIVINENWSGWKKVGSDTQERLLGVDMNDNGFGIAVGAFGTLMRSTDYGKSWEVLTPDWAPLYDSGQGDTAVIRDEPTNYVAKVFNDNRVLIGGEYGQLLTSNDGGDTWEISYRHIEEGVTIAPTFFDIKFYGDVGYAAGQAGLVVVSNDAGRSWTPRRVNGTKGSLFAVAGDAKGNVFAIGQRVSAVSSDQGATWKLYDALDIGLNWYAGVSGTSEADKRSYVAVGHGGRILSLHPFD